jgi:heterodisulfide reductase subunit A-like polyferredoxin
MAVEPRDVLIAGDGIAGIEALMTLADLGDRGLRVRMVAAHPSFVLRPQTVGVP